MRQAFSCGAGMLIVVLPGTKQGTRNMFIPKASYLNLLVLPKIPHFRKATRKAHDDSPLKERSFLAVCLGNTPSDCGRRFPASGASPVLAADLSSGCLVLLVSLSFWPGPFSCCMLHDVFCDKVPLSNINLYPGACVKDG